MTPPTPTHLFISLIFLLGTFNFLCILILFLKSKDGRLRMHLIRVFATLCWSYGIRASQHLLMGNFDLPQEVIELLIGIPLAVCTTWFVLFLAQKYRKSGTNHISW